MDCRRTITAVKEVFHPIEPQKIRTLRPRCAHASKWSNKRYGVISVVSFSPQPESDVDCYSPWQKRGGMTQPDDQSTLCPIGSGANDPDAVHSQRIAANGVIGMLLLVATEVMFFAGLISAFIVTRAGMVWPSADQPRLPIDATAANTIILLSSGLVLLNAERAFGGFDVGRAKKFLSLAIGLGACFVGIQGYEWARLISFGLTVQSSTYGAFFYVIVGAHALHAIAALLALAYCRTRLAEGELTRIAFSTSQIFWYFVVLLWPILYVLVYVV